MSEEPRVQSTKQSRRRSQTLQLNESPEKQLKDINPKSRRRSRSSLNIFGDDDCHLLENAAYKKDDIVLTKDTGSIMCVIKTIRSSNGLQYGIVIPPESNIRYIKPGKIVKKLCPESVIARIDTITKAYEDANGEMLKQQQQLKMARKQSDIHKDKFKKLKQRLTEQNHLHTENTRKIDKLEKENDKIRRELSQKHNDLQKIEREKADGNPLQKQLKEANKQIKTLNKSISQQKITINKQKTELSQQKAKVNRSKMDDKTDSKSIIKLKKDGLSKDRTISDLKQQMITIQNKLNRANYDIDRNKNKDKIAKEYNMEQIGVQQIRLNNRLKALKGKENELQRMEQRHKTQNKKQMTLQQQQDIDKAEKIFNRRKKQQLQDIAQQKQDVLRLQKLLQIANRYKRKKNKRNDNNNDEQKRYEIKRTNRTKIIVHKKYLCKEYMDCCVKWRKRKDAICKTSNQLKSLQESLKPTMKRLNKLDENNRISKGKNKLEKPNKNDLKEYLDVAIPLEDVEDQLGDILLDLHPDGKDIKKMPFQLIAKQQEIDRLNEQIQTLKNELEKYRLNNKIQKKLNAIGIDDDDENNDDDDDDDCNGDDENPYKQQFTGMYRMIANLNENKDNILTELRCLITKIGDDINDDTNNDNKELISPLTMDFAPKTDALCMEYTDLQQELSKDEEERDSLRTMKRIHRKNRYSDSENSYKGTDRVFMQKNAHYEDDDSSSIMSDSDDDIWSGTQRMSIHKTAEKVDNLTENAKEHLNELKIKQNEYKLIKQRLNGRKRDLLQCQGLLEVIEEKETESDNDDIIEAKENLRIYNEIVEGTNNNLENVFSSLERDDERMNKLMNELKDLKSKISAEKLIKLQKELVGRQTSLSLIPVPNVLELKDLRIKMKTLYSKALNDADYLENSIKCIEKCKKKTIKLQDFVEELSPSIHKFGRRPQRKLLEFMMEYNWDLGEIADRLKDRQQSLTKFTDKNQDIRMEESIEIGNELIEQQTVLNEYKKTIYILEEKHKGIMFDKIDNTVTEQGTVYELSQIMDEIADLMSNITQKINDNNLNLRTQRFGCFLCLQQINNTRDLLIDTVQIPIPSTPNIEDLYDDDEDDDNHKGVHLELDEMRMKYKLTYNNEYVQSLAGLTIYDDTMELYYALNRIRATLGSISPLHYAVISDNYLKPKIIKAKNELNKLLKNYQSFSPIKTDISIDDEVSNYEIQLIQDLAADYHKTNESEDKAFIIHENIKIIEHKLNELDELYESDLKCIELNHLKEALPLYKDETDYKTLIVEQYVGLNHNETIKHIDNELFKERSGVMPKAFNLIYQNGILFGDAFPGDFRKLKKYKEHNNHKHDDELVLHVEDYNEMNKNDKIELIKELMNLEWKYAEWINDREDFVTQKKLYRQEALYYKRLFAIPYYKQGNIDTQFVEERQLIEVEHKPSSDYEEERRMIEMEHKPMNYKPYGARNIIKNKENQCGFDQEYDSDSDDYESSEIDYLSVDSEYEEHKGVHIKEQQNADSLRPDDKIGAHGIGIDLEISNNMLCNLEIDDINHDIHCSPNPVHNDNHLEIDNIDHDIHCSPNPVLFKQNAMINDYIEKQIEMELMNINTTATQKTEESKEREKENDNLNDDTDNEDGEDEDEDDDDDDEYILDKLREILGNHQFLPCLDDEDEVDLMLDQIETLCRDVDKYHNKYINHSQKNKKLLNELEVAEITLDDLANEHDRLKQEYLKLRQENDELIDKYRKHKGNNVTTPGYNDNDDGMEERDILHQLKDDLLHLIQNINESKQSAKSEYKKSKVRMELMCEPLRDLANDFDSDLLKDALSKLSKSLNDINNLEKQRLYQHGPLANIVESNIDDIDDLLNSLHKTSTKKEPQTVAMSGNVDEMDKLYPELIYLQEEDDKSNDNDIEPGRATPSQNIQFDANFPVVRRIEIDGNWFNKKPRAVIEWNSYIFGRKMADFKWLWRMLLLNSSVDRVVPEYPNDIPESLWPEGYLRRRKRELNLFLMQCHSLPWIKKYNLYYDIFLEKDKKEWKKKRNQFDQDIMHKIKNKKATYYQSNNSHNHFDNDRIEP